MDETAPTVVVVGASAGGVEPLTALAGGLPENLDAAICVVLHLAADAKSRLADIISRAGPLSATQVRGNERLEPRRMLPCAIARVVRRLSDEANVSENGGGEMSPELAYEEGALDREQESVKAALRTAISAFQERGRLTERLAERVDEAGAARSRRRFEALAEEARGQAEMIRRHLAGRNGPDG